MLKLNKPNSKIHFLNAGRCFISFSSPKVPMSTAINSNKFTDRTELLQRLGNRNLTSSIITISRFMSSGRSSKTGVEKDSKSANLLSKELEAAKPSDSESQLSTETIMELPEAYVTSGVPGYMHGASDTGKSGFGAQSSNRQVLIYRPARSAMQSGEAETTKWQVDFDAQQKWENPMIGWASSDDPVQALRLRFDTAEQAESFCRKQGWDYQIAKEPVSRLEPRSYGDNFKYVPANKLRFVRTK